jgi:hypothetical protein
MFAPILAVLAASGAAAQSVVTPVTPSGLTQCVPILFQWSGGQAPYYVSIGSADTSSSP